MKPADHHPLLVLGMHRSGTSYLARLVQSMGVFIGDELVGPQEGNPRGHFEAVSVLEFHQHLIASRLGPERRAFDDGMLVQEAFGPTFTGDERRAAESLAASLRRPGPWGWKEPRTCLFLDLWKSVLPDARAVIVYRHPLEVQQSLLRRRHWDLALFPDQVMRAYRVYSQGLAGWEATPAYCFNANSGFRDLPRLAESLARTFGLDLPDELPAFHTAEFRMIPVSRSLHRLFSAVFPETAAAFDALQQKADLPYAWEERPDDAVLDDFTERLQPLLEGLPEDGRAWLAPLLDWLAADRDKSVFTRFAGLAGEIGERVRKVEEWNRQAAEIHRENDRLHADNERLGRDYARQQKLLEDQTGKLAHLWEDLSRTGDSWKEQRDLITRLQKEKKQLQEKLDRLR